MGWIRIRIRGFMPLTNESGLGSGPDPDLDPDLALFVIDLQDANKTQILFLSFSAYCFLKVHVHYFRR